MSVGKTIGRWRRGKGLTQKDAAKLAGISQAAWSNIESGDVRRIGLDVARRIVRACDGAITLEDFLVSRARPRP